MLEMNAPRAANARDRVLTDNELVLVLSATRTLGIVFGAFFELLAITGQRRSEVAGLDWSELNREEGLWILPEKRCKNGVTHLVPLSTAAIGILDRLSGCDEQPMSTWPTNGLVFTTKGKTPISGFSRAKKLLDAAMLKIAKEKALEAGKEPETIAIADWRIHDLRRTMATGFQKLGIRFVVTEATLNHVSGMSRAGVAGVYQQHDWKEEKREALEKWATHCENLLSQ
jgi:integrase